MKTDTDKKQYDAPNGSAVRDCLTRVVSYPIVQFYRIEAKMWRELYQKQKTRNTKMNISKKMLRKIGSPPNTEPTRSRGSNDDKI